MNQNNIENKYKIEIIDSEDITLIIPLLNILNPNIDTKTFSKKVIKEFS